MECCSSFLMFTTWLPSLLYVLFIDSLSPYLLSSSPSYHVTNSYSVWFSFEFSEPILLLYNPSLSFFDNLQVFTEDRLLSTLCSPGIGGDCISIVNGNIERVTISSDRLSFLIHAFVEGILSVHIPKSLITDLVGNQLKEDIHHEVEIGPACLTLLKTTTVAFSSSSFAPMVLLKFSNPMQVSLKASSSVIQVKTDHYVQYINSTDITVFHHNILIPFDTAYTTSAVYSIRIPPGFFKDFYNNYFRGYTQNELEVKSSSLYPLIVIQLLTKASPIIAFVSILVGCFSIFFGLIILSIFIYRYKNLYNATILNNTVILSMSLAIILFFITVKFIYEYQSFIVIITMIIAYALMMAVSVLLIRTSSRITIAVFTAGIGFAIGHILCQFICECVLLVKGYMNM